MDNLKVKLYHGATVEDLNTTIETDLKRMKATLVSATSCVAPSGRGGVTDHDDIYVTVIFNQKTPIGKKPK